MINNKCISDKNYILYLHISLYHSENIKLRLLKFFIENFRSILPQNPSSYNSKMPHLGSDIITNFTGCRSVNALPSCF